MRLKELIEIVKKHKWVLSNPDNPFINPIRTEVVALEKNKSRAPIFKPYEGYIHISDRCCPITVSFNQPAINWGNCAKALNIEEWYAKAILHATDYTELFFETMGFLPSDHDKSNFLELRKFILKAANL